MSSEYIAFDFTVNEKWNEYTNGIFPTPTPMKMEMIKRKWYKSNINTNFDVNFDSHSKEASKVATKVKIDHLSLKVLNLLDGIVFLYYFFCFIWIPEHLFLFSFLYCSLYSLKLVKRPFKRFENLRNVLFSEHFQSLITIVPLIFFSWMRIRLFFYPFLVMIIFDFFDWIKMNEAFNIKPILKLANIVMEKKILGNLIKVIIEYILTVYIIHLWLTFQASIFNMLVSVNILRVRYVISEETKIIWDSLINNIKSFLESKYFPSLVAKALFKIGALIKFAVTFNVLKREKKNNKTPTINHDHNHAHN